MKKNDDRFITAIFCDDIRQEIGNKLSFMGCYQGELFVQTVPTALTKLCVFASILTPIKRPFKSLMLRVVHGDDVELARIDIPEESIAEKNQIFDETSTRRIISTAIVFSPFVIENPTMLRLLATTEEGEITGPRLLIKVTAIPESAVKAAKKPKPAKPRTIK